MHVFIFRSNYFLIQRISVICDQRIRCPSITARPSLCPSAYDLVSVRLVVCVSIHPSAYICLFVCQFVYPIARHCPCVYFHSFLHHITCCSLHVFIRTFYQRLSDLLSTGVWQKNEKTLLSVRPLNSYPLISFSLFLFYFLYSLLPR